MWVIESKKYRVRKIVAVGNSEMKIASKSTLMAPECTIKTQGSNNWGKENLFVPFAPVYNDFTNSMFFPYKVL